MIQRDQTKHIELPLFIFISSGDHTGYICTELTGSSSLTCFQAILLIHTQFDNATRYSGEE